VTQAVHRNSAVPPPGNPAPSDSAAAIVVNGLNVVRSGNHILADVSVEVPRSIVFGLIGPSGSGKTTFMRSIAGRQRTASGSIRVEGVPSGHRELRNRIGYMPQETAVYEDLSGRENLEFFASIYRIPRSRIDEVVDLLDMREAINRSVMTYSGGQQQRIALGIALLPSPSILLLDEPTVGLDPKLRQRLWSEFADWAAAGTTLLISTHVMDEAARADRLAFFAGGRVVAQGSPSELLDLSGASTLEDALLHFTDGEVPV
jgi:ABC-2 type transport system ATP-binding protein